MSAVTVLSPLADAPSVAVREAWGKTLVELAAKYPELVVLDGDLANSTRADIFAAAVPGSLLRDGHRRAEPAGRRGRAWPPAASCPGSAPSPPS